MWQAGFLFIFKLLASSPPELFHNNAEELCMKEHVHERLFFQF